MLAGCFDLSTLTHCEGICFPDAALNFLVLLGGGAAHVVLLDDPALREARPLSTPPSDIQ